MLIVYHSLAILLEWLSNLGKPQSVAMAAQRDSIHSYSLVFVSQLMRRKVLPQRYLLYVHQLIA